MGTNFRDFWTFVQGLIHDGDRDLYKVFGYAKIIKPENYWAMYKRNPIAGRAIRAFPQATWGDKPVIHDEQGEDEESSNFAKEVQDFFNFHSVYDYLERADRLSGIGRFSILVMGFADNTVLSEPLNSGNYELKYLQAYSDYETDILTLNEDPQDERFGMPEIYQVQPMGSDGNVKKTRMGSFEVHHSRIIHVAEFLDSNDIYGTPRLECVYNNLQDLTKTLGGSSEMFWLNGRAGMSLIADKDAALTDDQKEAMKKQAKDFVNQMSRVISGSGIKTEMFNQNIPDPRSNVETTLDVISGGLAIPKRILTGSERGELSSSQDENNFNKRTSERQVNFAIPRIIKPFVEKMIETGNISEPQGQCFIKWKDDIKLSPQEQSDINAKNTDSLVKYSNSPSADIIVPPSEFRTEFLGLPAEIPEDTVNGDLFDDDLDENDDEKEFFDEMKGDNDEPEEKLEEAV